MRTFGLSVAGIESALTAIDSMELQNSIHPLPKVDVTHWHHLSETFPSPTVFFPLCQPI